jgi:hypothetical protein
MNIIRWILFRLFRWAMQESRPDYEHQDGSRFVRYWSLPVLGDVAHQDRFGRIVYRW